jgi:phage gp16-like protein
MSTPAKRGLIGAIKAGQAYLGWDDVTYRSVLSRLCNGKTSSTKCTRRTAGCQGIYAW